MSINGKPVKNPAEGHRGRLRTRLERDAVGLFDYEVLELALGFVHRRKDTKPLAKRLIARFGSLRGVCDAPGEDLLKVEDAGPATAAFFEVFRELRNRCEEAPLRQRIMLCSTEAVLKMSRSRLGAKTEEEMWGAFVDNGNRLLAWERLTRGTVNATPLYPREVAVLCLKHKATGFILVHNHPGGNPAPSSADLEITRHMFAFARSLGLRFLDHIIVTAERHCSFRDDGLLTGG